MSKRKKEEEAIVEVTTEEVKAGALPESLPKIRSPKVTRDIRAMIRDLLDDNMEKVQAELAILSGKDYLNVIMQLMKFVVPTISQVAYENMSKTDNNSIVEKLRELKMIDDIGAEEVEDESEDKE